MSAEKVILINLLIYLGGFAVFLWQRDKFTEQSIGWLSIAINFLGVLLSLGISLSDVSNGTTQYQWFNVGNTKFTFDFLINSLTFLMFFVVQFVALLVQIFSVEYMKKEAGFGRYFAFMNLFVFSMLGIVISGNLLLMYFFWEVVGLSSYFLIGFWFEKQTATNAAKKAFIVNRVGDVGFLIGIFLVFNQYHTLTFESLSDLSLAQPDGVLTLTGLLLFCGCVAKSAQFPLHIWLPDAMEGPTPVSALMHAATMVAAGVFMLARISFLLSSTAAFVIIIIGTFTLFLGAFVAVFQYDMKKVLAYSTVSQLGLMVIGIGIRAENASLFHLITHAFFKAGLFLCIAAVIHQVHEQDMRKIGGLRKKMPHVFYCYMICAAAIAGIPFFSGFLSKDALLMAAYTWAEQKGNSLFFILPFVIVLVSGMTAFYIMRQLYMIFIGQEELNPVKIIKDGVLNISKNIAKRLEAIVKIEDDHGGLRQTQKTMDIQQISNFDVVLSVLALASMGFVFSPNPFNAEKSWFFQSFPQEIHSQSWLLLAAIFSPIIGLLLGYFKTKKEVLEVNDEPMNFMAMLAFHNFYLNELFQSLFIEPIIWISQKVKAFDVLIDWIIAAMVTLQVFLANIIAWVDTYIFDAIVMFFATIALKIGRIARQIQNGYAHSYIATLFLGVIFIVALLILF